MGFLVMVVILVLVSLLVNFAGLPDGERRGAKWNS
jgi:hypothetical protein